MYIYLAVFILLIICTFIEYINESTPKILYYFLLVILLLMYCLRYGQGVDYLNYQTIYNVVPASLNPAVIQSTGLHGEIGWLEINAICKLMNISYELMIVIISVIESCFFIKFINEYCHYKILALLVSYPTLYLTYMYSAVRQGLVTCVFLGLLLRFYFEKKYIKYCAGCLILATIHSSALILLILIFVRRDVLLKFKDYLLIASSWMIGFIIYFAGTAFVSSLPFIPYSVAFYINGASISVSSIAERAISYIFVAILISHKTDLSKNMRMLFNVYSLGFVIYGLLLWNPLISSRLCYSFKAIEIILIANLLYYNNSYVLNKAVRYCIIILLTGTMYLKNIGSYIEQGNYKQMVNIYNYPYVSLIKKNISKYKY